MANPTKQCSMCKEIKELSNFYSDKYSEDGLCYQCKPCQRLTRIKSQEKKRSYELALKSGKEEDMIVWKEKYCPVIDYSSKECTKCKINKDRNEFFSNSRNKNGLSSWCKKCIKENNDLYISLPFDPPPEIKKCTGCHVNKSIENFVKDRHKKDGYSTRCNECQRASQFKNKFDITIADYNSMMIEQNGKCAICEKDNSENYLNYRSGKPLALSVDHCHKTGIVRGLLCSDCNTALGLLKDNQDLFYKAVEYLNKKPPKKLI
jgi:hypothetical protein